MIKQVFDIDGYWEVIVYWNMDYNFFGDVEFELMKTGFSKEAIEEVYDTLMNGNAKAVTCSRAGERRSVVIFNTHTSRRLTT